MFISQSDKIADKLQFKKNKVEITCRAYDCKYYHLGETCARESVTFDSKGVLATYVICKDYEEIY